MWMYVHPDYSFPVIYVVMTSSIVPCCKHLRDVLVITVVMCNPQVCEHNNVDFKLSFSLQD